MKWNLAKVLITGAGGFIGSQLVEKLAGMGAGVVAFVRYNSRNDIGLLELLPERLQGKVKIIMGDLRDSNAVGEAIAGVDYIFHLGALIAIPYSYVHPQEVIDTNVLGTLNVLNSAKYYGVKKIIHTSTSEVYGTAQYVPIDEKHPLQGQSPYSASKIAADKIAESFYRSFGLPIATIRPFNTYGPRQSARAVIPTIITQVLTGKTVILGNLDSTRDFTYVDDTVNGFIKVAESRFSTGEIINIGSGAEISIREITEKISKIAGKEVKIKIDNKRLRPEKSEVQRLLADNTKAKNILKWEPEVTLDEGLKRTVAWIKKNISKYKPAIYQI